MRRFGIGLLSSSLAAVILISLAGPGLIFVSWALAAASLMILARCADLRRAALAGAVTLAAVILLSLLGAGVTIGRGSKVLAVTPTLDPSVILVSFGIVASFWATAAFLLTYEAQRRQRLALAGAGVIALGLIAFVGDELARAGVTSRPLIAVGGSGPGALMVVGGVLLLAAFIRASIRMLRVRAATGA